MTELIRREDLLTEPLVRELQAHAREAYPNEAVGAVLIGGSYLRMENVAADPTRGAEPPHRQVVELLDSGSLRALAHSHPDGPNCPSAMDMATQLEMEVPFIITSTDGSACLAPFAWGDQLERLPLVGRGFQHGVSDCFEMVRDYHFLEQGKLIKQFPRDWNWWANGQRLYEDGFREAGFREIDPEDRRVGDCFMAAVRSSTPNHAGILVEPDLVLHHGTAGKSWDPLKLSRRTPLLPWAKFITHWVRHE